MNGGDVRDVVEFWQVDEGWRWRRVAHGDGRTLSLSEKPLYKQACLDDARANNPSCRLRELDEEPEDWE